MIQFLKLLENWWQSKRNQVRSCTEGECSRTLLVYLSLSSSQMAAPYIGASSAAVTNVLASLRFTVQLNGEFTGEMSGKVGEVIYSGWTGK